MKRTKQHGVMEIITSLMLIMISFVILLCFKLIKARETQLKKIQNIQVDIDQHSRQLQAQPRFWTLQPPGSQTSRRFVYME